MLQNQHSEKIDTVDMQADCTSLIFAAAETTTTHICSVLYNILRNPSTLKSLTQEIRFSFKYITDITSISTHHLPYLQACINESFRLFPPGPHAFPRVTPRGGAIINKRFVPEHTTIGIPHFATYRSANNFKHPDSFKSERWLEENIADFEDDQKNVLRPFGYGNRACMGQQ